MNINNYTSENNLLIQTNETNSTFRVKIRNMPTRVESRFGLKNRYLIPVYFNNFKRELIISEIEADKLCTHYNINESKEALKLFLKEIIIEKKTIKLRDGRTKEIFVIKEML